MNKRIKKCLTQAGIYDGREGLYWCSQEQLEKYAELVVEAVLDEVKERAYYTGDRDWSDGVDRQWIQLEFGYGKLHDAKRSGVK